MFFVGLGHDYGAGGERMEREEELLAAVLPGRRAHGYRQQHRLARRQRRDVVER